MTHVKEKTEKGKEALRQMEGRKRTTEEDDGEEKTNAKSGTSSRRFVRLLDCLSRSLALSLSIHRDVLGYVCARFVLQLPPRRTHHHRRNREREHARERSSCTS